MAFLLPATEAIMTEVELVISALSVVRSTFFPLTFSSIPNSSTNAPRVPDPSSRESTVISAALANPPFNAMAPKASVVSTYFPNLFITFSFNVLLHPFQM